MPRKAIFTDQAPRAIGPYVQAIEAGGFIFCSGQLPMDPDTGELVTTSAAEATACAIENLAAVLDAAGLGLRNVVKTTIFLKNMDHFDTVNEVYGRFFKDAPPARACVEVARLPKDALVEIEAIACRE